MLYIIKSNTAHGGLWDSNNNCLVKALETTDKAKAEKYKNSGYDVEEKAVEETTKPQTRRTTKK